MASNHGQCGTSRIQVLLGHAKLDTTALYTRVAVNVVRHVISPLDRLTALGPPPA